MKTSALVLPILFITALSGCAKPPGFLAAMYDNNDPCQKTHLIATGEYPSFCGAGSGTRYVTRDYQTGRILTVTKAQK
jgi:hypothetical protein